MIVIRCSYFALVNPMVGNHGAVHFPAVPFSFPGVRDGENTGNSTHPLGDAVDFVDLTVESKGNCA